MRIFKSFKKVFSKPIKFYQRAVFSLGMVLAANQSLMAAIDPMEGINSLESFVKKALSVVALIVGFTFLVKGIWDFKKAHNDFKTGQKDIFAYVILAPTLALVAFCFTLAFCFGISGTQ